MNLFKGCRVRQTIYLLPMLLIGCLLSGCIQSKAATSENDIPISSTSQRHITDNTLKVVNAAFYPSFILGEWRYKGARNFKGKINAYIQIPGPLEMSKDVQKSYLRTAICPSSKHTNMWNEIDGIPLSVHIYTHKQKQSLYVDCVNPLNAG
ncbi:MAG: hypothetical protein ABJK37_05665 [Paraglaciecola sp.]|uniref:hypothetical protein n=1 Tax=Paraglaciecola sp. TaxID=1920173 RepID=UPI003298D767